MKKIWSYINFTSSEVILTDFDKKSSLIEVFLTQLNIRRWKIVDKTEFKKNLGLCIAIGNDTGQRQKFTIIHENNGTKLIRNNTSMCIPMMK